MTAKVFISYRRDDSRYQARMIHAAFRQVLPEDAVFMDIDSIPLGANFRKILNGWVAECEILLALIGPGWTDAADPKTGARRLDNPSDFVRIEIGAALARDIPVVPVLLDGAPMPDGARLPDDLKDLVDRQAEFVEYRTFDHDVERLIRKLGLNGEQRRQAPAPAVRTVETDEFRNSAARAVAIREEYESTKANNALILSMLEGDRYSAEGRIEINAKTVNNTQGRWFLPGNGKTEWFKDYPKGPEMVVVPAGEFLMGSPEDEPERDSDESPRDKVTIAKPFAVGRFAVTRGEFAAFVKAKDHKTDDGAYVWTGSEWELDATNSWRDPGFAQDDQHPVVCVNWRDANAYADWLAEVTEKPYRLLSEAEWEYVCRAGTTTPFWWGKTITPAQANYDGNHVYKGDGSKGEFRQKTVSVDSFQPNQWGLFQVHGNVWEWCGDCWNETYDRAPANGAAWTSGDCSKRVLRGGSWVSYPQLLRSANRFRGDPVNRSGSYGFRVGRMLTT